MLSFEKFDSHKSFDEYWEYQLRTSVLVAGDVFPSSSLDVDYIVIYLSIVGLLLHNGVKRYLHELVLDSAGLLAIVLSSDLCRRFAGFSSCFGLGIGGGGAAAVGTDYSNVVPVSVLFASS
ncbi:hypothetical protein YC2023_097831 [Brassica napus]